MTLFYGYRPKSQINSRSRKTRLDPIEDIRIINPVLFKKILEQERPRDYVESTNFRNRAA